MKRNFKTVISIAILVCAAVVLLVLSFTDIKFSDDSVTSKLISDIISRGVTIFALVSAACLIDGKAILKPGKVNSPKLVLWCVPCVLVVLANFPYTALIGGGARIVRPELIALFALDCLFVGLSEELLFRGLLQYAVARLPSKKAPSALFTVAVTSAAFAVAHLFNLFFGAGAAATLMQVGYCFLLGGMLSAVMIKTNNIWLCAALHAVFDFGGNLVSTLGEGQFQDLWFWIFTAVAAAVCLAHILRFLIKDYKSSRT
ncbi:MAG: CPBP family intramembrane glutamic endopeptidase [Candidatus Coproplasma sp.]